MKKVIGWIVAALVIVSFSGVGYAGEDTGVVYKKKTVYDFEDDLVEGDLVRPEGDFIGARRRSKHSSLIKIREDFVPEMLKSINDI